MDFQDYLVGKQFLTRLEFRNIFARVFAQSVGHRPGNHDGFQTLDNSGEDQPWTTLRRPPFGEVLASNPEILPLVLKRANVTSIENLVELWHRECIREMECIGQYSPVIKCASNLYQHRIEKKIVARYAVMSNKRNSHRTIIGNGEKLAVLEGSSAFFVAMAAAHFRTCSIISSNGILNSEYLHNPCIAKSFSNFHIVGGKADFNIDTHTPEHAGVYGYDAQHQFNEDMREDPGATTLVVPCSGFLPETGPLATSGDVQGLKVSVIRSAVDVGVHHILFIADYSKMLPSRANKYGVEIFSGPEWKRLLRDNGNQMTLITAPPPALRKALIVNNIHPCTRTKLSDHFPGHAFTRDDVEYNRVAGQFPGALGVDFEFHEALTLGPQGGAPLATAAVH
jgi:hypothetical protein